MKHHRTELLRKLTYALETIGYRLDMHGDENAARIRQQLGVAREVAAELIEREMAAAKGTYQATRDPSHLSDFRAMRELLANLTQEKAA